MPEHLTDMQLTLFIDGALDSDESLSIRAHLAECPECASVFLDIVSVSDFNSMRLLQKVTRREEQRVEKALLNVSKCSVSKMNDGDETSKYLASKVRIALWLEDISKKASSERHTLFRRPVLKLLEPIAGAGLAAFMPNVAAASLSFSSIAGAPIVSLSEAAHDLDQAYGFLVKVLAENVLRLQITQRTIKKIRVRMGEKIEEYEVPASGTINININTLMPKNPTNWLTDVTMKKNDSRNLIMKEMEIELLKK